MTTDTRVIQDQAGLQVLAQRFEIMFKDGTSLGLHPVAVQGRQHLWLRAAHYEGLRWIVFDVRLLVPEIESEYRRLTARDHPGLQWYLLRLKYPTVKDFGAAALEHRMAAWWQHDVAEPQQAAA